MSPHITLIEVHTVSTPAPADKHTNIHPLRTRTHTITHTQLARAVFSPAFAALEAAALALFETIETKAFAECQEQSQQKGAPVLSDPWTAQATTPTALLRFPSLSLHRAPPRPVCSCQLRQELSVGVRAGRSSSAHATTNPNHPNTCGLCVGYVWVMCGLCMGYVWVMCGLCGSTPTPSTPTPAHAYPVPPSIR